MFEFISDVIRKRREAKRENYLAEWAEKEPELFRKWQDKKREQIKNMLKACSMPWVISEVQMPILERRKG